MLLKNKSLKTIGLTFTLTLGFVSCNLNSNNYKNQLSWLKGTWTSTHNQRLAQEEWKWDNKEDCYMATGFMAQESDTFYTQKLRIHHDKEDIFLSVNTASATESKEAFFKLTNTNSDSLVFKNVFDQYPLYIIYVNSSPFLKTRAIGQKRGQTIIDSRVYSIKGSEEEYID